MVAKLVPAGCAYRPLNAENIARTAIVRIVVDAMTGKENPLSSVHAVLQHSMGALAGAGGMAAK